MCLLAKLKKFICKFTTLIEFCHRCGRKQPLVWWCPSDDLWREVTDYKTGNGIYCPECFDKLAIKKGIAIAWKAEEEYRFKK